MYAHCCWEAKGEDVMQVGEQKMMMMDDERENAEDGILGLGSIGGMG